MGRLLSLLGGWQGYAAIAAMCFLAGSTVTWRVMSWREQAQKVQVITKTITQIQYQDRVSTQVVTKYVQVKAADDAHKIAVIKEIPAHVTPQIVADYPLPCAFGLLFNRAWGGPIPDPASCPDGAPSDTDLSTVAEAEAENAGKYADIAHQLTALQEWIVEQSKAK